MTFLNDIVTTELNQRSQTNFHQLTTKKYDSGQSPLTTNTSYKDQIKTLIRTYGLSDETSLIKLYVTYTLNNKVQKERQKKTKKTNNEKIGDKHILYPVLNPILYKLNNGIDGFFSDNDVIENGLSKKGFKNFVNYFHTKLTDYQKETQTRIFELL